MDDKETMQGAGRFRDGREEQGCGEEEQARRQTAEARMAADLREFQEIFPEAARDPGSIPREVWAEVRNGRSLVGAYARYYRGTARRAAEQAANQEAAWRQNRENAVRSVGSMRSAGEDSGARDPFLQGWEE